MTKLFGTEVSIVYIIAALQRTGSYLLCESLEGTGVVGYPTEPISPENMQIFVKMWDLDPNIKLIDYIAEVVRRCTGPNGIFGVKVHWSQIDWIRRVLGIGEPDDQKILDHLFPDAKYIRLTRNDIRAQAISSYRAYATDIWWRKRDVFNSQVTAPDPSYDSAMIRCWEERFRLRNQSWINYFKDRKMTPLVVEYENLDLDWRYQTRRCLSYLGQDPNAVDTAPEPTLMKQADAVSRAWKRKMDQEDAEGRKFIIDDSLPERVRHLRLLRKA